MYDYEVKVNAKLTYMYIFFEVMSLMVEDHNEINIEKCKQMHSFQDMVQLLEDSKNCWPLKRHLREYINRVYYMGNDYEYVSQYIIESELNVR